MKSQVWAELTYYAECPHCEEVEALGSELVFADEEQKVMCPSCGKEYTQQPPTSDEEKRQRFFRRENVDDK